jgi:hypothetical protein
LKFFKKIQSLDKGFDPKNSITMKKLNNFLILISLYSFLMVFTSCGKEDPAIEEKITAFVSEEEFSTSKDFDTVFGRKVPITKVVTTLIIQGTNNLGQGFIFRITPYNGVGVYEFDAKEKLATWINDANDEKHYTTEFAGTSGRLVISKDSENIIEGTFEFSAKNEESSDLIEIINGRILVSYL